VHVVLQMAGVMQWVVGLGKQCSGREGSIDSVRFTGTATRTNVGTSSRSMSWKNSNRDLLSLKMLYAVGIYVQQISDSHTLRSNGQLTRLS
jgi:hypothetical protein